MSDVRASTKSRKLKVLHARVQGTGTAAILTGGDELTLTDNNTGDYTLTFEEPFAEIPTVVATGVVGTDDFIIEIGATHTVSAVQILAKDDAGAAEDADFNVIIIGFTDPY